MIFLHCSLLSERERSPLKERNSNKYGSPGKQQGSPGKLGNLGSPNKRDVPITLSPAKSKQVKAEAPMRAEFLQKRLISAFFGFQWLNLAEILHLFKKYNNVGKVAVKRVSLTDYAL